MVRVSLGHRFPDKPLVVIKCILCVHTHFVQATLVPGAIVLVNDVSKLLKGADVVRTLTLEPTGPLAVGDKSSFDKAVNTINQVLYVCALAELYSNVWFRSCDAMISACCVRSLV